MGRDAFVRCAQARVRGAMLDELRQMDTLSRAQRRKVKVVQIARERWRAANARGPTLGEVAQACGMEVDEVALLDRLDHDSRRGAAAHGTDEDDAVAEPQHPVTERDEVEARVDTALVMRHLEAFFADLPEREQRVLDAYLGVGMAPVDLAAQMQLSPSRLSQLYGSLVRRMAVRLGHAHRSTDHTRPAGRAEMDRLVQERDAQLRDSPVHGSWGEMMEDVLRSPAERFGVRIDVPSGTRW